MQVFVRLGPSNIQNGNSSPAETISEIMIFSMYPPDCAGPAHCGCYYNPWPGIFSSHDSVYPKRILCGLKWYDQWFDPCLLDPRLVSYHVRLYVQSASSGVIVLCRNFVYQKSFLTERNFHTVLLRSR